MLRVFGLLLGCFLLLGACTQKLICPAYQSAFIYDKEALRKKFSYFNEDSTPKILTVSKNRYLMLPEQSYRKKVRSLKTVEMKPVYVVLPDSLKPDYEKKENEFAGAEQDSTDSVSVEKKKVDEDSTYVITKDKEVRVLKYDRDSAKYHIEHITLNADQDNYMWYTRDVLVLPDVRAALEDQKKAKESAANAATGKKEKKAGFLGFFKNLFKKKPNADTTTAAPIGPPPIDSDDPADSTAALEATPVVTPPPAPPKKKSMFGFLKKKKVKSDSQETPPATEPDKAVEPKPTDDKKEKKKEDDGFN